MTNLNSYDWPAEFWPAFIKKYWEQHPTTFGLPSKLPFINLDELFHVVTHMPERGRSDRFWVAKDKLLRTPRNFAMVPLNLLGPKQEDINFDGFFERMKNRRFGINIHALGKANAAISERVKTITNSLPAQPGKRRWETDTFFGTYVATPFGIHRDPASVFAVCLLGQRTYFTWPMDYFSPRDNDLLKPDSEVISRHLEQAERFDVLPGEVFYWPSNRWHVATSNGEPSVVAQVSAYFRPKDIRQA